MNIHEDISKTELLKPSVTAYVTYPDDDARRAQHDVLRFTPGVRVSVTDFASHEEALKAYRDSENRPHIVFKEHGGALPFYDSLVKLADGKNQQPPHMVVVTPNDAGEMQQMLEENGHEGLSGVNVGDLKGLQGAVQSFVNKEAEKRKVISDHPSVA